MAQDGILESDISDVVFNAIKGVREGIGRGLGYALLKIDGQPVLQFDINVIRQVNVIPRVGTDSELANTVTVRTEPVTEITTAGPVTENSSTAQVTRTNGSNIQNTDREYEEAG